MAKCRKTGEGAEADREFDKRKQVLVCTTVRIAGFHCWPDAPKHRAYLASRHRHDFVIKAWKKVSGLDRQVEIHDLADQVNKAMLAFHPVTGIAYELGTLSCEQLAWHLVKVVSLSGCEVLEDGLHGAICTV